MHDHWINQPCHADCPGRTEQSVTTYPCPEAPDAPRPHMLTPVNGIQVCHHCGKTEDELRTQIMPQGTGA